MKKTILPIVGILAMIIVAKTANPIVEIGGLILAGALGLGIGVALNSLVFREKKAIKQAKE